MGGEFDIDLAPLVWHPTTPGRFQCQSGCVCCCVSTLFFPSEVDLLPQAARAFLTTVDGVIRPLRRPPGVCIFFDEASEFHCTIFEHRPLRCRLYPYLPLVEGHRIVIVVDPFCTLLPREESSPAWFRCYGLGKGEDVRSCVEAMSREFLKRMEQEYPGLIRRYLSVGRVDEVIDEREVEKYRRPMFDEWDTAAIREASGRLEAEVQQ